MWGHGLTSALSFRDQARREREDICITDAKLGTVRLTLVGAPAVVAMLDG